VCPKATYATKSFALQPKPDISIGGAGCPVGNGAVGSWVNGASIFGYSDGMTYSNQNTWYNLAPEFELYDMDVCSGNIYFRVTHNDLNTIPL
jgi:hypothetical protein